MPCTGRRSLNHWGSPCKLFYCSYPMELEQLPFPLSSRCWVCEGESLCVINTQHHSSLMPCSQKKTVERRKHAVSPLRQTLRAASPTAKSLHAAVVFPSSSLTVAALPPASLSQHTTTARLLGTSTHTWTLRVMDGDLSTAQDMSQLPVKFHTRHHQLKLVSDCALWNITLMVLPFFLSFACPGDLVFFSLLSAIPELATDDISVLTSLTLKGFPSALDLLWGISWILLNKSDMISDDPREKF